MQALFILQHLQSDRRDGATKLILSLYIEILFK